MTDDADTRRYSLDELRARRAARGSGTRADAPARAVDAAFWRDARVVRPAAGKTSVHLRVDSEVLNWFREQGKGAFVEDECGAAVVYGGPQGVISGTDQCSRLAADAFEVGRGG